MSEKDSKQLLVELENLRLRVAELKARETKRQQTVEKMQRRAMHLETLNAIVAAAADTSDFIDLMKTTLSQMLGMLDLDIGIIWRSGKCVSQGIPLETGRISAHEAMAAGLAIAGKIIVEDWQQIEDDHPLAPLISLAAQLGIQASLAMPITLEGRRIGGLAVIANSPRPWLADEVALLQAIGQQLGTAAERLRLMQAEREQRELINALQEAAAVVSSTIEMDQVLNRILEQVERVVAGDAFNVMRIQDQRAQVVRWRGYENVIRSSQPDQSANRVYQLNSIPNLLKMIRTGKPIVISDTVTDPDWARLPAREWLRSYVGAPIRIGNVTVGFLNVNGTRMNQFNDSDAQRLQAFASHAATAIQNAQLYRELRNHAEQLEERVQKRTAQIQAQYAQQQAILQSTADGIIVTDAQGEIVRTNPIADTWLTQTLSPEDATRLRQAVQDIAIRSEERPEALLELTGLDLELHAAPITDSNSEQASTVIAVHDVSHLKTLDRMKSRFVSNVSHELRTPITTIKLYAALMRRAPAEKMEEYLDALTQEADRQARLIENILQVSRIDAGRIDLSLRPMSLNILVDMIVGNYQMLVQERGLTLEYHPTEPSPKIFADTDQLTQVLTNLMSNAIQYTSGDGKITISTAIQEAKERTWGTVTVKDTGMGIPKEELPHIFERFFRGEVPQQTQASGTGLGLAIAKEIVELHGGWISAESQVDEGSTFVVWLPLAE
jgi:signal transduction histidine kinase